ncbi:pyrimidine utilization protein D [Xylophilus rhododendri]|uniref:Putative carbamate hydrolase RutD n=1 Tax=Xylophilus rhododendri TaxID=2697032 RepID=A0A857J6D1_9BURK|nr:pyrimidine utilization protein D [Xylophilus rhododendri]QHI98571.1 pyrimidine utilization protein D [Xylophilus rhododendri]
MAAPSPLYHEVHGQGRPGAPSVLLSSGLGGSAHYWKPQVAALVDAGWRVVAYDQRGTGRSPATLGTGYTIADMAADVAEVMDASGTESCHLVGHALGGLVGLQLALDAPQRIASLVLINAWSAPNAHSARCFDARLELLRASGVEAYVQAQPLFLYPADWSLENAALVEAEVAHAIAHFPGADNMRARIAALRAFDVDARLGEIQAPVLVSASRDDLLVPWTRSQRLADGLPNATLDLLRHGAHAHNIVEAEAFNQTLLAFLARQPAGAAHVLSA